MDGLILEYVFQSKGIIFLRIDLSTHPISISKCNFDTEIQSKNVVTIDCTSLSNCLGKPTEVFDLQKNIYFCFNKYFNS